MGEFCVWEDCDQEASYCEGHAHELVNPLGVKIERLTAEGTRKDDYWRGVLRGLESDIMKRLRCIPDKSMRCAPLGCSTSAVSAAFRALDVCQPGAVATRQDSDD